MSSLVHFSKKNPAKIAENVNIRQEKFTFFIPSQFLLAANEAKFARDFCMKFCEVRERITVIFHSFPHFMTHSLCQS